MKCSHGWQYAEFIGLRPKGNGYWHKLYRCSICGEEWFEEMSRAELEMYD